MFNVQKRPQKRKKACNEGLEDFSLTVFFKNQSCKSAIFQFLCRKCCQSELAIKRTKLRLWTFNYLRPDERHVHDDLRSSTGAVLLPAWRGGGRLDLAEAGVVLRQEAVDEVGAGSPQLLKQGVHLELDLEGHRVPLDAWRNKKNNQINSNL